MKALKVAVGAEMLPGGGAGGIEQFLVGLVYALGLADGRPEEYLVIGPQRRSEWLKPYLGPNQRIAPRLYPEAQPGRFDWAKSRLGPLRRPAEVATQDKLVQVYGLFPTSQMPGSVAVRGAGIVRISLEFRRSGLPFIPKTFMAGLTGC
jgi:hypothetical protein